MALEEHVKKNVNLAYDNVMKNRNIDALLDTIVIFKAIIEKICSKNNNINVSSLINKLKKVNKKLADIAKCEIDNEQNNYNELFELFFDLLNNLR